MTLMLVDCAHDDDNTRTNDYNKSAPHIQSQVLSEVCKEYGHADWASKYLVVPYLSPGGCPANGPLAPTGWANVRPRLAGRPC